MFNSGNCSVPLVASIDGNGNNNGGWGNDGWGLIWIVLIFAIFGWGNGFGGWGNNGGGLVDVTCNILDELLPEGLIVYTEDKYGNRQEEYSDAEHYFDGKMAVLVNGNSASASEIFAGAIKDYGVGTLIGTQTFGKGIVQSLFPLSDGSAIKITVSRYYTPAGNNIHEVGIAPDIVLDKDTESADDNQLQKAIEVLSE